MKTKLYVAVVLGGALLFVAGNLTASGAGSLSENTQANLSTAMHGEAFAYAKYLLYAKEAQHFAIVLAGAFLACHDGKKKQKC